jgi:hypothetical protein
MSKMQKGYQVRAIFERGDFSRADTGIDWLDFIAGSHSCKPEKV